MVNRISSIIIIIITTFFGYYNSIRAVSIIFLVRVDDADDIV